MKCVALIPARYHSTRLPGKMLLDLAGKPLICRVFEQVKKTNLFDRIIVVTDNEEIARLIDINGGESFLSQLPHQSGTDRIAEAARFIEADLMVNVQGDEPFISREPLQNLLAAFDEENVAVASLMHEINEDVNNPNNVKVITDKNDDAIYFSRAVIPFDRDDKNEVTYHKHIGVYAFRKRLLLEFVKLPQSNLEKIEKLEQLRLLENGIKIRMVKTNYTGIGIDTKEDYEKANEIIRRKIGRIKT